jgi:hypothetical protein
MNVGKGKKFIMIKRAFATKRLASWLEREYDSEHNTAEYNFMINDVVTTEAILKRYYKRMAKEAIEAMEG